MAYDGTLKFDTSVVTDGFKSGVSKLGSIAKTGLTAAAAAIGAVSAALTTAGGYAIKVGSDFEAGMSQVAAISGATGEELDALTEKAKEMGAKTKFSATESAEAFNYMAMAGWKTGDMLNGIEGIMDLAAASGEDLAMVSDIVTDALTAFGMEAKDSGHFADVLAAAASNSNTNVGKMGYTFKYVAPIAGAMKYSIEDTAVAIGLMANAGIKGEQAGTSLRGMLTRLVKPTDAVAGAMEELGICMTNADGSMRPLDDVIGDLRTSFSKLSDSEKTYYAATIAGQEAMSGMLAIVNASESDFNKLTAAINGADGAAKTTAETMQDNLKGAIEELSGSAETLGLEIYEGIQTPLKEATLKGVEYVNQITEAFQSGGLEAAVMEAGNIFGELAVKAAEQAPKMIDAAVNFVQSFIQGIADNKDKLLTAAKNIVSALVNGLVKLLPKEIQKPVKETIDILKKSFQDGGLRSAINTVRTTLQNLGKVVTNLAKALLPPLAKAVDFLADNLDILLPLVTGIVAALKTMSIVKSITTWVTGLKTALGLATVATQGATTAQLALNGAMSANPIGIVIGAVGGLITILATLWTTMEHAPSSAERLEAANQAIADSYEVVSEKALEFQQGIETAESYLSGFNDTMFASAESQQALEDEMQRIQDGITTICKLASDERRGYTDQEITQLDNYFQRLNELQEQQLEVQRLKAEAITQQGVIAAQSFSGSLAEYEVESQRWIATAREQADAQTKIIEEQTTNELALLRQKYGNQATLANDAYKKEYDEIVARKEERLALVNEEVGKVAGAWEQGYLDQAEDLGSYLAHISELQKQEIEERQRYEAEIEDLRARQAAGEIGMREKIELANYNHEQKMNEINARYADGLDKDLEAQAGYWFSLINETEKGGRQIELTHKDYVKKYLAAYDKLPENMKEAGKNSMAGMLGGFEEKAPDLFAKASSIAGSILNTFLEKFGIASPSKVMKRIYRQLLQGGEVGFDSEAPKLFKKAGEISSGVLKRFSPKLDVSAMVAKMKAAVAAQRYSLSASLGGAAAGGMTLGMNTAGIENAVRQGLNGARVEADGRQIGKVVMANWDRTVRTYGR